MSARTRAAATAAALAMAAGGLTAAVATPAQAVMAAQSTLPSVVPSATTPDVMNGEVDAIARVGTTTVLGGTFTSVEPHGGKAVARSKIVAFNASTGALTTFNPTITGNVSALIPGPGNTVYVGGAFSKVNGVAMRVALLDLATGAVVSGWKPPALNAATTSLVASGGKLFVGGIFTTVAKKPLSGIIALDPKTGALLPYLNINVAGHHSTGGAKGSVGVSKFDIDPAGTHLVAIGDFTSVTDAAGVQSRDQVFRMNLGATSGSVDLGWNTIDFTAQCHNWDFDSSVRDVQFDPTGTYFVIVSSASDGTNVDGTRGVCDAATRWETNAIGTNLRPTWIDYTGLDSLWSVAVTGSAIFVGGHQRWMNNQWGGFNGAQAGAVPRAGLAALDPANGLPLAWNPGRNPRGAGAWSLLATSDGLYVGSDTDWIGNRRYHHDKIAFFPLAGGLAPASTTTASLPGTVYEAGQLANSAGVPAAINDELQFQAVDPAGIVAPTGRADVSMPWSSVRGAVLIGDTLFYGLADGTFNKRSFKGGVLGTPVAVDPYNDPAWVNVQTGSGQTYRGSASGYYTEISEVSSAFFTSGRLYYTRQGMSQMFYRYFSPDSGTIGAEEFTVADGMDWSGVAGALLSGHTLYYANQADGVLRSVSWAGDHATGPSTAFSTSRNWATRSMFIRSF